MRALSRYWIGCASTKECGQCLVEIRRDLANDPEHEDVKRRMIAAMQDWQRKTKDPFLDPGNVSEFVSQQMSNRDLGYRRRADFRWSYLDTFPLWKSRRDEDR